MGGRKYTESGTICKGDTRGTVGNVQECGPGHVGSMGKWSGMCRNAALHGGDKHGKAWWL